MFRGRPAIECPGSYRPRLFVERHIIIQIRNNKTRHYGTGCRDLIYVHDSRGAWRLNLEALMLTPKMIREVERCLLLCLESRAVVVSPSVAAGRISEGRLGLHFWFNYYNAMCLLARLVKVGSPGKAAVAQVLNMLGGPMERMECWGPPGSNKRRPCKVKISMYGVEPPDVVQIGSPENYHATD